MSNPLSGSVFASELSRDAGADGLAVFRIRQLFGRVGRRARGGSLVLFAPLFACLTASLFLFLIAPTAALAQSNTARITAQINENLLTTLRGNTHPLAKAQYDLGAVADSQPLHRMLLLLQRSPQQEAALRTLIDQQQTKTSASFHQWLTPQQYGQQFGPSAADLQTVTSWLQSHGFQIARVSASGMLIEFSGTAGQVRNSFHTEIHQYRVNGETHFANNTDPQIPAALAPVVAGPVSLHNFPRKPASRIRGTFQKDKNTGKVTPLPTAPSFTFPFSACSSNTIFSSDCFAVGPGDFAKIYNVNPLWNPGIGGHAIDGTGQTIAIVGDSEICTANSPDFGTTYTGPQGTPVTCSSDDVAQFRAQFGLPANTTNVILDGPDPGFNSDETEGDLDVQWSGAIAKSATIDFVIAEGTEASAGTDLAAEYIVDNNLAPVMSESFSACEAFLLQAGTTFESQLWEQAAAQGITVIVAAGDSGSAGCDDNTLPSPNTAINGANVNGIASTPFNVAAGGTDFDTSVTNYPSAFWATTNSTSPQNGLSNVSALSYIPEVPWNDSCARTGVTGCNSLSSSSPLLNIVAGGGGQSSCVAAAVIDSAGDIQCEFAANTNGSIPGWNKPAYQVVATGSGLNVGNDLTRDLPDISLFSADGMISNSFYIICESDMTGGPCSLTQGFLGVGGTSSSAPSFAGIMAMVDQNMAVNNPSLPARQGNANYVLYPMFTAQQANTSLNCNSSSGPSTGCTFNDVTKGNNSVPCAGGSANCSAPLSGHTGIIETGTPAATPSYIAGTGFDLATGLGSVDAFNLVSNWPATAGTFTPTTTTLCLTTTSGACPTPATTGAPLVPITHGTPVYVTIGVTTASSGPPPAATLAKSEDVALLGTFTGGAVRAVDRFDPNTGNIDVYSLGAGGTIVNASTTELVGGTYTVAAHYGGDGKFGSSTSSPGISITVNPENSALTLSTGVLTPTGSVVAASSVPYGALEVVRADVAGGTSGLHTATGTVTIDDKIGTGAAGPIINPNGVAAAGGFPLNTEGYTEDQTAFLAVGAHSITAQYAGDASYNASTDTTAAGFTVTQGPTVASVNSSATSVAPNTNFTLTAFVDTQSSANPSGGSSGVPPSGTVTFFSGSTSLGTATLSAIAGGDVNGFDESTAVLSTAKLAATGTITAVYSGDGNYVGSTSTGVNVTVTSGAAFSLSAGNSGQITASAPGQSGSDTITVTGSGGFAGTVTLTVSTVSSLNGNPPTCSFGSTGSVTLSTTTSSGTATLTCNTVAPSAVLKPASRRHNPSGPDAPNGIMIGEAGAALACLFVLGLAGRKRRGMALLVILLLAVVFVGMSCGSSGSGSITVPGTSPGSYVFTVTGTSGGTTQTTTVTLNVQ